MATVAQLLDHLVVHQLTKLDHVDGTVALIISEWECSERSHSEMVPPVLPHTPSRPPKCVASAVGVRYRSKALNWHFRPHSPTLFSNNISPEEGLITIKAQQLTRSIVLRVQAPLDSFTRVGGPTRVSFVAHSVESYSATATAGEPVVTPARRWCDC